MENPDGMKPIAFAVEILAILVGIVYALLTYVARRIEYGHR